MRGRKEGMRSSRSHFMKGGPADGAPRPPVLADVGARAPRPPVLADVGARAPRPPVLADVGARAPRPPVPADVGARAPRPPVLADVGARAPRPPVPADVGARAPRPPVLADAGAGAPRPRMDDAERMAAIEKAQAEGWAKKQADIAAAVRAAAVRAAAVRAAAAGASPRTIERSPDRKRGELASARETGRRSRSPVSTPISSMEAPRPAPSPAAPRPGRSVSPTLDDIAFPHFSRHHLHDESEAKDMGTRATEIARERSGDKQYTNTLVGIPHTAIRQIRDKLRAPGIRSNQEISIPLESSAITTGPSGSVVKSNKRRNLKAKVGKDRSGAFKLSHFTGYES